MMSNRLQEAHREPYHWIMKIPEPGANVYTSSTRPSEGREIILDHLSAWEKFLHGDHGMDPLAVMTLPRYKFEAIPRPAGPWLSWRRRMAYEAPWSTTSAGSGRNSPPGN